MLGEEMKKFEDVNGFVIDGFPANLNQGNMIFITQFNFRTKQYFQVFTSKSVSKFSCQI